MALQNGYWEFSHSVTLGIWVRKSGAWQKLTQVQAYAYTSGGSGGTKTVNWYVNQAIQLGTGIEAFGVTVDGQSGSAATVNQITSIQWTAQGSSGNTSSALPNGLKTTVTVRPK